MSFFRRRKNDPHSKNKPATPPGDDAPALRPEDSAPEPAAGPGRKPHRLRAAFDKAARRMRHLRQELGGAASDTLRDLRQPKELGLLVLAIVIPGGTLGWGAYRLQKYRAKRPGNQNQPADRAEKPSPPRQARRPRKKGPGNGGGYPSP